MIDFKNISVLGGGLMGHGIALKFAQNNYQVTVYDLDQGVLKSIHNRIRISLEQMEVSKNDINKILSLIVTNDNLKKAVQNGSLIVEAAPEKLEIKQDLFRSIEDNAPENCIFASNTSVIPITKIVEKMNDKTRALGTHWWNPPHLIPLVEVIKTKWSSEYSIKMVIKVLKKIGKKPVRVEKDVPGFIGNRLQHALWREAISLVENGVCDAASVDTVIKSSFGRRLSVLGPLENADLVGTDLTLDIHENVLFDLESNTGPSKLLRELVKTRKLGMKSGEGFQKWTSKEMDETKERVLSHLKRLEKIL